MLAASLDFETYSELDLRKVGAWKYAEHPSTEVICAAYAAGDDDPGLWLPSDPFPFVLENADEVHAWNAEFELAIWLRCCMRKYRWPALDPRIVRCTMSLALSFGLPGKLEKATEAVGADQRKDARGSYLINKLCKPRPRTSKANPEPRWTPITAPEDFAEFYAYCRQDVRTERGVKAKLPRPFLPPIEQETYLQSLLANQRGICIDTPSVEGSISGVESFCAKLEREHVELTGYESGQIAAVRTWLHERGLYLPNMQAETIRDAAAAIAVRAELEPGLESVARVLTLRQSLGQTSVSKFYAMQRSCCNDGRIHGMLQYHGAATGRWAGRLVQLQNLKKPGEEIGELKMHDWIERVHAMNPDVLEIFGDPMAFFSAFVRPCLVASPGKVLLAADFSAIECRVLAWLAGETWLLDTFAAGGDVYIVQATDMYGRPITKADLREREVGKRIVLGCGYQMAAAKFRETAKKYGVVLSEEFAEKAVESYRRLNRNIVKFWYAMQDAMVNAIERPGEIFRVRHISFKASAVMLQMRLPSGRLLTYWRPRLEPGRYGPRIVYDGLNPITKQWGPQDMYGGRAAENATSAVARDACRDAILRMTEADRGYDYLFSSHDEIVSEVPWQNANLKSYCALMAEVPDWLRGCPIKAEGWEGQRYRKA